MDPESLVGAKQTKPHQEQFHILPLELSGTLGGCRARCQLR